MAFATGALIFCIFLICSLKLICAFPMTLQLERAFPANQKVEISELVIRDRVRHRRILQSSGDVVDFPVDGSFDPYVAGLYFTKLQLGSPPRDFYVQIDTGSDVLWVTCGSCNGCPQTSGLPIQLNFFDAGSSSTSSFISCSDKRCSLGVHSSDSTCSSQNQCTYTFQYGDGSGTSGYYVSDLLHMDTIVGNSIVQNASAQIVFGCSSLQTGDLTKSDRAVDGIFGFGQQGMSVISQLASQGIAPKVFSHCLRGDAGGILVIGEVIEPNIIYSPLVPSQYSELPSTSFSKNCMDLNNVSKTLMILTNSSTIYVRPHYNLNLQSISVNGQILAINPAVFATSSSRGTIVDSGTTLAYLPEEAYVPFVNAITAAVSQSVRYDPSLGNQCYTVASSVNDIFPQVSLNFAGGASMTLRPQDYLLQKKFNNGDVKWCLGIQMIQGQGITILGDVVLKDKIFVYDLVHQRIGWANYDCSMSVNVSATPSKGPSEFVNAGQLSNSISFHSKPYKLLPICLIALLTVSFVSIPKIFPVL